MNVSKRLKNVLVPVRELFEFAQLSGLIDKNPMTLVKNPKVSKPDIHPLSMEEVNLFLENVIFRYKNFFTVAFFTGMRFGEMSAIKWKNVDFKLGWIFYSNNARNFNKNDIIEALRPIAISLALNLKLTNNIEDLKKLKGLFELIPPEGIPVEIRNKLEEIF